MFPKLLLLPALALAVSLTAQRPVHALPACYCNTYEDCHKCFPGSHPDSIGCDAVHHRCLPLPG